MLLGPGRGGMPKPGARINPVVGVTHHELGMADLLTHDIKFCIHIWSRNDPVDTNYWKGRLCIHVTSLCCVFSLDYTNALWCFMHDWTIKGGKIRPGSWMALFNPMVQGESGSLLLKASLGGGPARPYWGKNVPVDRALSNTPEHHLGRSGRSLRELLRYCFFLYTV